MTTAVAVIMYGMIDIVLMRLMAARRRGVYHKSDATPYPPLGPL
jgi:hypothetical protein